MDENTKDWARIKSVFRLTKENYLAILETQQNVCAICKSPESRGWFCVDHDHACCPGRKSCGQCIRGLICDKCNVGLGAFRDSSETLQQAIEYLNGPRPQVDPIPPKVVATHCKNGHEWTPDNTAFDASGYRCCRRCSADRTTAYRKAKIANGTWKR